VCVYTYIYTYIYIYIYIYIYTMPMLPRVLWGPRACRSERLYRSYLTRKFNQNLSGNQVYYTACSLLSIFKISYSQLHCQKGFNLILFSYKMYSHVGLVPRGVCLCREHSNPIPQVPSRLTRPTVQGYLTHKKRPPP